MIAATQVHCDRLFLSGKSKSSQFLSLAGSLVRSGVLVNTPSLPHTPQGFSPPTLLYLTISFRFCSPFWPKNKMPISPYCRPSQSLQVMGFELPPPPFASLLSGKESTCLQSPWRWTGSSLAHKHGTPKATHTCPTFPSMNHLCGGGAGFLVSYWSEKP